MNLHTYILKPGFSFLFCVHRNFFLAELLPHVSGLVFITVTYLPPNNCKYRQGLILFLLILTSWKAHNTAEET